MEKSLNTTAAEKKQCVKMTTAKLAKSFGLEKNELRVKLLQKGLLRKYEDEVVLTRAGRAAGGESRFSNKHGVYFLWPNNFTI